MEQQLVQVLFDNDVTVLSSNRFGSHQDPAIFSKSIFVSLALIINIFLCIDILKICRLRRHVCLLLIVMRTKQDSCSVL